MTTATLVPCAICGRELRIPSDEAAKHDTTKITCSFTCRQALVAKEKDEK